VAFGAYVELRRVEGRLIDRISGVARQLVPAAGGTIGIGDEFASFDPVFFLVEAPVQPGCPPQVSDSPAPVALTVSGWIRAGERLERLLG
jgi:hypothetical protein